MEANIKVEKFLMRQGIRVGKAAIEFKGEGPLNGFLLVGFTICDDPVKGKRFVMFPMAKGSFGKDEGNTRNFFFLRPDKSELLDTLSDAILDVYEGLVEKEFRNVPRLKQSEVPTSV